MPEQEEADTQPTDGEQMPEQDALHTEQDAPHLLLDAPAAPLLIAAPAPPADEPSTEPESMTTDLAVPADEMNAQADEPEPLTAELEPPAAEPEPLTAELELPAADPEPPAPEPRRLSRAERDTLDRHLRRFGACGRCGYFIADCRLYLGEEQFQDAVLDARDGWVRMEGDREFHRLAANAYGIQLDTLFDSFSGTCPECRRRFDIFNTDEGLTRLKVHV